MMRSLLRNCPGILALAALHCFSVFAQPTQMVYFDQYLDKKNTAGDSGWTLEKFCPISSSVIARRVLESYGSMFVAHESVNVPPACVQKGEAQVIAFQKKMTRSQVDVRGVRIDLQSAAAQSLQKTIDEAFAAGLTLSALDGPIAGGRSYGDTLMIWNSRVFPGLNYWLRRGKLTPADIEELSKFELEKKVERILEWESKGIYFSTDKSRSILTSTAPPGASQHIALIAFDVVEYWDPQIRSILNRNGWYQTVVDDPNHFTYLGVPETELPSRGLVTVAKGGYLYWIPNLPAVTPQQSTN